MTAYQSQCARDAARYGYGDASYWEYLDKSATEHAAFFLKRGDAVTAALMLSQSLGEALAGNDGD